MKFLIVTAEGQRYEKTRVVAKEVERQLSRLGQDAAIHEWEVPLGDVPDIVIAIGGDGTVMRALRKFSPLGVPTFGINAGNLGFLTGVEAQNASVGTLERLINGTFQLESRQSLQFSVNGRTFGPVVNEIIVQHQSTQAEFEFWFDDTRFYGEALRARGVLVSTATGSTAQNVAEGGPLVVPLPGTEVLAVTPMNGPINVRPLVFQVGAGQHHRIKVIPVREVKGQSFEIIRDGLPSVLLKAGTEVIIEAGEPLLLITWGLSHFEEALRLKKGFAR